MLNYLTYANWLIILFLAIWLNSNILTNSDVAPCLPVGVKIYEIADQLIFVLRRASSLLHIIMYSCF